MRTLALALADEAQRFVKGYPPKGSWLFMRPNHDISRLAGALTGEDVLTYVDERCEPLKWSGDEDLCLVHVGFGDEHESARIAGRLRGSGIEPVFFGPQATAWDDAAPNWVHRHVIGDLLLAWPQLRRDSAEQTPRSIYRAPRTPEYFPASRSIGRAPQMNARDQTIAFRLGCACPNTARRWCPSYLYHGDETRLRERDEVIGEVLTLPGKHIDLLDDDVASEPEYYFELFRHLWNYRRLWKVRASDKLFQYPWLIRLLAKAGTRIVFLDESFLGDRIEEATRDERLGRALYRRIKFLQSRRMLVGARIMLDLELPHDYRAITRLLRRIDLDFLELRCTVRNREGKKALQPTRYRPMLSSDDPAWIRNSFYNLSSIGNRAARRPRRVGFYTTVRYLLPYSLSYRQNLLEGLPYP